MSGFGLTSTAEAAAQKTASSPLLANTLLVAIVGVLVLVAFGLVALAIVVRRRSEAEAPPPPASPPAPAVLATATRPAVRPRVRPRVMRSGGGLAMAAAASPSSSMVCPTCKAEYYGMAYCTRDARRLVPLEEMAIQSKAAGHMAGLVCMACRRAFDPGARTCPHDGHDLVPVAVYNATRPRRSKQNTTDPAGVIAQVCPTCNAKFDLNARFCGHDAGALVVIN